MTQHAIAHVLARITNLRVLRFNINFHTTCGLHPGADSYRVNYTPWLDSEATFAQRGTENMEDACPLLEYVALLQHRDTESVWVQWSPPWRDSKGRIDWAWPGTGYEHW